MANYYLSEDDSLIKDSNKVIELGSGTGLAGLFIHALFNKQVYLTDICSKSLKIIRENV